MLLQIGNLAIDTKITFVPYIHIFSSLIFIQQFGSFSVKLNVLCSVLAPVTSIFSIRGCCLSHKGLRPRQQPAESDLAGWQAIADSCLVKLVAKRDAALHQNPPCNCFDHQQIPTGAYSLHRPCCCVSKHSPSTHAVIKV